MTRSSAPDNRDKDGANDVLGATRRRTRRSSLASVSDCLRRPKGRLAQLVAQTDRLATINRAFRAYLPPHLHDHAKIVSLSAQHWVIQTHSSAWATRLRYVLPQLQQQLSEHFGYTIPVLKLRVQPAPQEPAPVPQRRMQMTEKSAALLAGTAQGIADQRLGAALRRLAENASSRAQPAKV